MDPNSTGKSGKSFWGIGEKEMVVSSGWGGSRAVGGWGSFWGRGGERFRKKGISGTWSVLYILRRRCVVGENQVETHAGLCSEAGMTDPSDLLEVHLTGVP